MAERAERVSGGSEAGKSKDIPVRPPEIRLSSLELNIAQRLYSSALIRCSAFASFCD
jgi:hypothetical protein